ncbi:unnamed protein product, partial [Musa acuminata var. zebrina]
TEEWLVETSLTYMVNLKELGGMSRTSPAPRPRQPDAPALGDLDRSGNSEHDRSRKKPKTETSKMSEFVIAWEVATHAGGILGGCPHGTAHNEEAAGSVRGKECAGKAGSAKAAKPASM